MKQDPKSPGNAPQPDAAGSPAPASGGRRFLGGASADGVTDRGTVGVRLFASASVFTLLVLLLLMFVLSLRDRFGERLLVTAAVADYTAPEFPPLEFVQQDLERLRTATGPALRLDPEAADLPNFTTAADLARLIDEILPAARQNSLIVYVRMHAVSTAAGLFLAPADGDPGRPQDGIALARLLQAAARSPCRNKLLLLDLVQNDQRPSIGWLGADIRRHLDRAFETVEAESASNGGLYVVCASGAGQASRSSAAVQHSLFGGLASYCLHGGVAADGAGPTGRRDSRLTAGEITAFLQQRVSDWSLDRWGQLQEPVVLQSGRDFPLVSVDEFLSLETYFAGREPLADAGKAENERRKQEFADGAAAAPPPTGGAPAGPELVPTPEALAARLLQSWQHKQTLAATNAPLRRPRHWALYHQELRRAEMLFLAGRVTDAIAVLDTSLAPLERDLDVPAGELLQRGWSTAYADLPAETDSRWSALLQEAITAPTAANLDRLGGSPYVELELARRAAERLAAGDAAMPAWSGPKLLQQALAVRALAERAARLAGHVPAAGAPLAEAAPAVVPARPELLPVMRSRLEAADRLRLAAEHELFVGRLDAARAGLSVAQREYETALDAGRRVEEQLNLLHATLIDAASLADWLAQSRRPATWRQQAWKKLDALLAGAAEFRSAPTPELLVPLAALCRDLRQAGVAAAREAVAAHNPVELRASLELPFLDPPLRAEVLWTAVNLADGPRAVSGRRRFAGDIATDEAPPFPLAALLRAAAVEELAFPLPPRGALAGATPPAQVPEPSAASAEVPGGEELQQALAELHADPLAMPPGATAYQQYSAFLVRASFQSRLLRLTSFRPVAAEELFARLTSDHLTWHLARLSACESTTGIDVSGPRGVVLQNLRQIDPSYQESQGRPVAAVEAISRNVASDSGVGRLSATVRLRSAMKLAPADKPQFVVDWFTQRDRWRVDSLRNTTREGDAPPSAQHDGAAPPDVSEWRARVSVGDLALSATADVAIELQRSPAAAPLASDEIVSLAGWIELADGSRYGVPLELNLRGHAPPTFEIAMTEPAGTLLPGRMRLYPNQRVPLTIGVFSRVAESTPIVIAISSGDATIELPHTAAPGAKPAPVATGGPTELAVTGARLKVESLQGGQAVDAEELSIDVLNPRTAFACEARYLAETRTLTVDVRRLAASDAAAAVPIGLTVTGVQVESGSVVGELPPDADEATLEAKLLATDPASPCLVSIAVCGVPDTFAFQVDMAGGVVTRTYASRCDIVSPAHGTAYLKSGDAALSLPVVIAADSAGECLISLGIDRNNDGYLQVGERIKGQTTWSGKSVETRLVAAGEPPQWGIESRVTHVMLPMPAAGLVGPQRILVQMIAGDRTLTASRMVYFVEAPPPVEVASPRQNEPVALGDPLPVALRCRHAAARAVAQVQVGVDRNNNGVWDDDETLDLAVPADAETSPFDLSDVWNGGFDTRRLLEPAGGDSEPQGAAPDASEEPSLPRRLVLMARTSSLLSDLAQPEQPPQVTWGPPVRRIIELISMSQKPVPTGDVAGRVTTVDGLPQRDVVITLGDRQTRTDDDGRFVLRNVPIGPHVVAGARGVRFGQTEVVVSAGATSEVPLTIAR